MKDVWPTTGSHGFSTTISDEDSKTTSLDPRGDQQRRPPTPPGGTRPTLAPGTLVGRYRIDTVVGQGAWSTVYRATDTALNLAVVLKVLSPAASPTVVDRFKNEILFSRRVNHPGFCRIYELHEEQTFEGALRYLTMELVEGRTLGDLMNEGPMAPGRALDIARSLCDVVAAAHDQGVVHGDLKPGNIMVRTLVRRRLERRTEARDELVVLDFGAASAKDLNSGSGRVGSLRYMAPELFEQGLASPQSDVWAIGVILYGCLTGTFPFDGKAEIDIAEATRHVPKAPSTRRDDLPPGLNDSIDDVVMTALERDRTKRYADCRAFASALDGAFDRWREATRPTRSLWRRLVGIFGR